METATLSKVAVGLNPVPGFCVKSRATNDAQIHPTAFQDQPHAFHVPIGLKVFVNVAWDSNVPPPPPATEDAICRTIQGLDIDPSPAAWFVPIVLSDARQDMDKAGQSAIVFDCVLNPSLKSRTLKDPDFKNFIIELALQRIESQTSLVLSREIGTPNIASKGKPRSRRVLVPATLYPPGHPHHQPPPTLIQEISDRSMSVPTKAVPKSILKNTSAEPRIPTWSWMQQSSSIRIVFDVPGVTYAVIPTSTLDVEPRRILLHVPNLYHLDLNLEALDSELSSAFGKNDTADAALKLKRMRNFDVDRARAEWRVADKVIVLVA
ncbi:pre-RNA processing PIH1/Nop17-domain-containing protein [Chiua virens]|nr:pre-RNA processing PIH1/Nop17-domain-containing protein [Chiua virens]